MLGNKKIRRPVKAVAVSGQRNLELFGEAADQPLQPLRRPVTATRFVDRDPRSIRIGDRRLDEHLQAMGLRDGLRLRQLLSELDWNEFVSCYSHGGRPGYAPWLMVGIILFGLMRGTSSLRELERFAKGDLECMWVSGGISPDHSILGRFIMRYEQRLSGPLFEAIVQKALQRTGSDKQCLAGDGTVLEAMSSRFALIKREALQQLCEQAQEAEVDAGHPADADHKSATEGKPADSQSAQSEALRRAHQALSERPRARAVVIAEPEAGLLKLKNGRGHRPASQVAVLANAARVVVDAQVHGSNEQAALMQTLKRLESEQTQELLLDAGFNSYEILELTLEQQISVLCPEQSESQGAAEGSSRVAKHWPMRLFRYEATGDYYVCPSGQQMHPQRHFAGNPAEGKRAYVQYATPACRSCHSRSQCTTGQARTVQRTQGQDIKEALRQVMQQPQAKQRFAQRKAMVEPVFSTLRERHGLNRLRRCGLSRVRLEVRLHLMAYNLARVLAYARRGLLEAFLHLSSRARSALRRFGRHHGFVSVSSLGFFISSSDGLRGASWAHEK